MNTEDNRKKIMQFLKKCNKIISLAFLFFMTFTVLLGTIPYAFPPKISQKYMNAAQSERFYNGAVGPDRIALVETREEALVVRLQLLQQAEKTADIVYYRMHDGSASDILSTEIIKTADRGVKIRLLVDDSNSWFASQEARAITYALASHENIEYLHFNKFNLLTPWKHNVFMHDKFIIVDNKLLLLGGRNVGDGFIATPTNADTAVDITEDRDALVFNTDYQNQTGDSVIYQLKAYMDEFYHSTVVSPAYTLPLSEKKLQAGMKALAEENENYYKLVKQYPKIFQNVSLDTFTKLTVPTNKITHISNPLTTGPKQPQIAYELAVLAKNAKESIVFQTPYATGDRRIISTINEANQHAKVDMLTNSPGNAANIGTYPNYFANRKKFIKTGTTIHEYQGNGSLHGKAYVFDDRIATIGSFNLDNRSININTESMLVVDSPAFNEMMRKSIQSKMEESLILQNNDVYEENPNVVALPISLARQTQLWFVSIFSRLFQFLILKKIP